jgi:cell division protein FtsB
MTGIDLTAEGTGRMTRGPRRPSRFRIPATRAGVTWLVVLLVVGALLAIQVGRQVYANFSITQEAAALRQQIAGIETENDGLRQQLDYLQSDAYISAEARRLANLGRAGDRLLIIPEGAEAALPVALQPAREADKPLLEQWLDLFFGG